MQWDENNEALFGAWKLASSILEDLDSGEKKLLWGEHPNGCLVLTPARRLIVIQTAERRKFPQTDEDRVGGFETVLACSGRYRNEGSRIVVKLDLASDETWNGAEQVWYYRLENDQLHMEIAPQRYLNLAGGKIMRGFQVWQRDH